MPDGSSALKDRAADLLDEGDIREQAEKLYDGVVKGFDDQRERTDKLLDYWDLYDCKLGRFQNFSGMSKIFLPIIRNAVNALVVRYVNQAFPNSGRHVECVTGEQDQPYALLSLIEHYIAEAKLRTQAAVELLLNGQIEGQYNCYFNWGRSTRSVVTREEQPIEVDGISTPELGTLSVTIEEDIEDSCPDIEVLHDADVLVLPATAKSIDHALEIGGSVTVLRRWTEAQIEKMRDDGEIDEAAADELLDSIGNAKTEQVRDTEKKLASNAGVQVSRGKIFAIVFETWHKFAIDDKRRLCRAFFTGEKKIASIRRNPFWNDRCPVHSAPVKKIPGVFKGESPVACAEDMQILANDMINEGADMMYYTLAPVLAVDPQKVSKWKELVADIAAVWPVDPDGVKMFEWPNKVREALEVVGQCKQGIFEALQVNPAMMPQQTGKPGAKRNQAEVALEQQVDLMQSADAVTVFEQEILTPFVQWCAELDHQFRDDDIVVREYGELGLRAEMEQIKPIQWGKRWEVRWIGVETQRNAANIQQQISFLNVLNQIPQQELAGYTRNIVPVIESAIGAIYGARLGRQVFQRDESPPPEDENELLADGFEVLTHASDDDVKHNQVHAQLPPGPERDRHMAMHNRAIQLKQQAAIMQRMQSQQPGQGQPQRKPRRAQGSRPGAQAQGPRQPFQPAGTIRPDNMAKAGALMPPRKSA